MNYRRLSYFLAVVDAGTVTAAAQAIPVAQPALSRQIKTLERELRFSLFESHGNRLVLTAAGRAFVPAARTLIAHTRGLEGTAETLRSGRVDSLTLASTSASVRSFIASFIATTTPADPILLVHETGHFDLADALTLGADFIVSPAPPDPAHAVFALGRVALAAFVAPDHAWAVAGRREITLAELAAERVIVHSHQSVSRQILDQALSREQLGWREAHECDDGQTILALAAAGQGVGVTTELSQFDAHPMRIIAAGTNAQLKAGALDLPLHVAWPPDHFAADIILALAGRIRAHLASRYRSIRPDIATPMP